ncbi:MAG: thioredoxin-dependent thiol peroxidase [Porticoccaceae bacterium]|nr:thioredoxin-dependent thiol peroxidase [Porticoccaceae bacterium]|tara:strand:+ start:3405 stop:3872 length:468 start_codon:yes stop_codon:yes gene_type:complete
MLPSIGSIAPNFSLLNQNSELISLNSFRGQNSVLLYFYPRAMTPGCTTQACGIRDSIDQFDQIGAKVLAISPDTPEKLKKFVDKEALNFTLLSDVDHAVADSFGAWGLKKFMGKEYMGILRYTYVIDVDGKIKHIIKNVKTKTHHQDSLQLISDD